MRDLTKWSKPLREALRQSQDLQDFVTCQFPDSEPPMLRREISRLAQLIAEVELGLTLLREIAPEEPAISVSALLLGYRFPVVPLSEENNWKRVQTARFYLVRRKGNQWEYSLGEYIRLPEILRIFSLTEPDAVPRRIPTSTYPKRFGLYQQTLLTTPPHKKRKTKWVTAGYWYARIFHSDRSPLEIPINIPEAVAGLEPSPQLSQQRARSPQNPPVTVTLEELQQAAVEMDETLVQAQYEAENYGDRLQGIALQLYNAATEDFQPGTALKLERLIHIVGLLNVGKSTLLEVLLYYLAKQGYRCGLMVNDVVAQVRLASLFWYGLGIPAAPILGSDRAQQLEKAYAPLLATQGEEIEQGGIHPAWRWFSPVCPLLALVQSAEKWEFGEEPCHALYRKVVPSAPDESDDEESQESETEDKYTCPFYDRCPRHQLERDIISAGIWVLTPASFIHTRVPRQGFAEPLTFAEAVYRQCNFLFVDEADRVQVQMDEAFAPNEVLVDDSGNSLLNQLGLKFAAATYYCDRRNMAPERIATAKKAHDFAQIATDIILPKLHTQPKLEHLHFAILVTVLSNRLGYLVDHLSEIARSRSIDLHDTSLSVG
ncbi:MAG: hypothetical protein WA882_04630 [Geitlerinemataceae cyanobacterium]